MESRSKLLNHRYALIEHLKEPFSMGCADICAQANITVEAKDACDLGYSKYCAIPNNIANEVCVPFVSRALAPERVSTNAKAIRDQTIASVKTYMEQPEIDLQSTQVNNLMSVVKNDPEVYKLATVAPITKCIVDNDAKCSTLTWLQPALAATVDDFMNRMGSKSLEEILVEMTSERMLSIYKIFTVSLSQINQLIASKITTPANLVHKSLITLRDISSQLTTSIDLIVINFILNSNHTFIPVLESGEYNVDITTKATLYDPNIYAFYKLLLGSQTAATDKLTKLITVANISNKTRCATVSSYDPVCIAMKQTGDPGLVAAATAGTLAYCSNSNNIGTDACIEVINNAIINDKSFDKVSAYKNALVAATNADGTFNRAIFDKLEGMMDWLKTKTADIKSIDIDGIPVVESVCGTPGELTIDQCKKLGAIYPDLYTNDNIAKCGLAKYRYLEGFGEPTNEWMFWLILFIFIALIVCASKLARKARMKYLAQQMSSHSQINVN